MERGSIFMTRGRELERPLEPDAVVTKNGQVIDIYVHNEPVKGHFTGGFVLSRQQTVRNGPTPEAVLYHLGVALDDKDLMRQNRSAENVSPTFGVALGDMMVD